MDNIYQQMNIQLLESCNTIEEQKDLLKQIVDEAIMHYNGDVELAIKNRYECDMSADDVAEMLSNFN